MDLLSLPTQTWYRRRRAVSFAEQSVAVRTESLRWCEAGSESADVVPAYIVVWTERHTRHTATSPPMSSASSHQRRPGWTTAPLSGRRAGSCALWGCCSVRRSADRRCRQTACVRCEHASVVAGWTAVWRTSHIDHTRTAAHHCVCANASSTRCCRRTLADTPRTQTDVGSRHWCCCHGCAYACTGCCSEWTSAHTANRRTAALRCVDEHAPSSCCTEQSYDYMSRRQMAVHRYVCVHVSSSLMTTHTNAHPRVHATSGDTHSISGNITSPWTVPLLLRVYTQKCAPLLRFIKHAHNTCISQFRPIITMYPFGLNPVSGIWWL